MNGQSEQSPEGHTYKQWIFAIIANFTFFSYGLQNGWISPFAKLLQSADSPTGVPLTSPEFYWVASVSSFSAIFGVPIFAYIADRSGRKIALISIIVVQSLCWIIKLCPSNTTTLIVARLCGGLGAGGTFSVSPMYVKEISQTDIRGTLGFMMTMAQSMGYLMMYAMGAYVEYYTVSWTMLTLCVLNLMLMIFAPESPAYLIKIGHFEDSIKTIALLRGLNDNHKSVVNEFDEIKREDEMFRSLPNISFLGILRQPAWRRGFIYMICVMIAHGLNGVFSIVTFASTILETSGVTLSPELQSMSIPAFMIIASLLSMCFVERVGRKVILSSTHAISALGCTVLGTILLLQHTGVLVLGWLPVVTIVITVCCYSGGVQPVPFIIMSEMFNFQIRAKLMACIVTLAWLESFVQAISFGAVSEVFGAYTAFYIFAGINVFGAVVTLVFLPETRGKSVEEIEMELKIK